MKTNQLKTFYRDFNDSINYFYEENTHNFIDLWIIDPEVKKVYKFCLYKLKSIEETINDFLECRVDERFILEKVRIALNDFIEREYDGVPYLAISDLPRVIPLAYTTAGDDEEHELQVSFDRTTCELIEELDGVIKQRTKYTLEEFADMMENVGFDDLTRDLYNYIDDEEDGE